MRLNADAGWVSILKLCKLKKKHFFNCLSSKHKLEIEGKRRNSWEKIQCENTKNFPGSWTRLCGSCSTSPCGGGHRAVVGTVSIEFLSRIVLIWIKIWIPGRVCYDLGNIYHVLQWNMTSNKITIKYYRRFSKWL